MEKIKVTCMAVDDEPLALDLIETHVKRHEQCELIARFTNPVEAIEAIERFKPDVLFIDMQMPKLSGFEVIQRLNYSPIVVLTTAYNEYAVDAYEFDVFDYLLKPISKNRFDKSIEKIMEHVRLRKKVDHVELQEQELFIRVDRSLVKIMLRDIYYVQGLQKYVQIYTTDGRFVTLYSLGNLAEETKANGFFQCHKSFLINLNHVDRVEGNDVVIQDTKIPISKTRKSDLLELLSRR